MGWFLKLFMLSSFPRLLLSAGNCETSLRIASIHWSGESKAYSVAPWPPVFGFEAQGSRVPPRHPRFGVKPILVRILAAISRKNTVFPSLLGGFLHPQPPGWSSAVALLRGWEGSKHVGAFTMQESMPSNGACNFCKGEKKPKKKNQKTHL